MRGQELHQKCLLQVALGEQRIHRLQQYLLITLSSTDLLTNQF